MVEETERKKLIESINLQYKKLQDLMNGINIDSLNLTEKLSPVDLDHLYRVESSLWFAVGDIEAILHELNSKETEDVFV